MNKAFPEVNISYQILIENLLGEKKKEKNIRLETAYCPNILSYCPDIL